MIQHRRDGRVAPEVKPSPSAPRGCCLRGFNQDLRSFINKLALFAVELLEQAFGTQIKASAGTFSLIPCRAVMETPTGCTALDCAAQINIKILCGRLPILIVT